MELCGPSTSALLSRETEQERERAKDCMQICRAGRSGLHPAPGDVMLVIGMIQSLPPPSKGKLNSQS